MAEAQLASAADLARDIEEGLASATTATERAALVPEELTRAIDTLKAERDAVILAHYYVSPEVQAVADYVGDSFYLAKLAKSLPQQTIVLCGVEFMGESAKLLNPNKTVLLPEPGADCPMAHMVKRETVDAARAQYGDDLAVVCYVNSTVEIKSWSDVCDQLKRREDRKRAATKARAVYPRSKPGTLCCRAGAGKARDSQQGLLSAPSRYHARADYRC